MRIPFTKMQGAGNDFVVLDETRGRLGLSAAQYRFLGDRHFGVGADQILCVRPAPPNTTEVGIDFEYAIHNADGGEVEHCGNGARCFLSFVRQQNLTQKDVVRVQTLNRVLELHWQADGRVTVDMGVPEFAPALIPFNPAGLVAKSAFQWEIVLNVPVSASFVAIKNIVNDTSAKIGQADRLSLAVVSMGNPHAVLLVDDAEAAPVQTLGPAIQAQDAFPQGVNVGFMQIVDSRHVRLRVYERGAGETLACGTGACAAVVCGIRLGLLGARVDVLTHGGTLTIEWAGGDAPVLLTGPATTVFTGEIDIPDTI